MCTRRWQQMRRRDFIRLVVTATMWPLTARAQQSAMPVIGFLNSAWPDGYRRMLAAFREGLERSGYADGKNVKIEYRWAEGSYDRLPALAADLVHRRVAVIAATSTPAALAAKASTKTIPIVFTAGGDPVELRLVASWSRPGGNMTGASELSREVAPKRLELAHELIPTATVLGLLTNPQNPSTETRTGAYWPLQQVSGCSSKSYTRAPKLRSTKPSRPFAKRALACSSLVTIRSSQVALNE